MDNKRETLSGLLKEASEKMRSMASIIASQREALQKFAMNDRANKLAKKLEERNILPELDRDEKVQHILDHQDDIEVLEKMAEYSYDSGFSLDETMGNISDQDPKSKLFNRLISED